MISVSKMSLAYILQDYRKNFHGKRCYMALNYKGIEPIEIHFNDVDLYHLLGLGKVTRGYRAKTAIEAIDNASLTIRDIIRHHKFNDIKYRIQGYKSLHSMLINPKAKVCILRKDLDTNTMDLDLILWDNLDKNRLMILGLRKGKDNIYYPTTLHRSSKKKYDSCKRTYINTILWI